MTGFNLKNTSEWLENPAMDKNYLKLQGLKLMKQLQMAAYIQAVNEGETRFCQNEKSPYKIML